MGNNNDEENESPIEKFINAKPDAQIRYLDAIATTMGFQQLAVMKAQLESARKENEAQQPGVSDLSERSAISSAIKKVDEYKATYANEFASLKGEDRVNFIADQYRRHGNNEIESLVTEMKALYKSESNKTFTTPDKKLLTKLVNAIEATSKFLDNPQAKQAALTTPGKSHSDPGSTPDKDNDRPLKRSAP